MYQLKRNGLENVHFMWFCLTFFITSTESRTSGAMALLTLLAIYLVYLHRVPRTVGETGRSKKECVRLLLRSLWSLLLAIAVIIVFLSLIHI